MADTQLAPGPGADDGADTALLDSPVPAAPARPAQDYDLPWRIDVPKLSTLRIVRKELPPREDGPLLPEDPDGVLTLPAAVAVHHRVRRLRLTTMNRLGLVALGSAALGFVGSTSSVGDVAVPQTVVSANPVGRAGVIDADLWQSAAPRTKGWSAGPIVFERQNPESTCASAALPADRTVSRHSTGTRATGDQQVTRMVTAPAARRLVERYLDNLRACQKQAFAGDGRVEIRTLGTYPKVADGLTVVGVFYRLRGKGPLGPSDGANLFAVGRDGRFVTTLELDLTGSRARIPVEQFTAVARAALTRLR